MITEFNKFRKVSGLCVYGWRGMLTLVVVRRVSAELHWFFPAPTLVLELDFFGKFSVKDVHNILLLITN